ncbi:MAG TPA: EF-P lysine aminoacylase EpmA [Myxococcales bacterium]|jgi:lysyl-tRNA synthetase class 2
MPELAPKQAAARARARLQRALRDYFASEGFDEVETPCLVPAPGMEPHIRAFEVPFVPETSEGRAATLYLHTSPEYAMKRLLASGFERVFQLCKVFRNGEIAPHHNPEFTMLEFYRAHASYEALMVDLEELLTRGARAVSGADHLLADGRKIPLARPFERLTVRDALLTRTGLDLRTLDDGPKLRAAAEGRGLRFSPGARDFDDVFFQLFLTEVEPTLGMERPTFLIEYPASMASLSRLKPGDPSVAERVELYAGGVELANGFSELTDGPEQRRRLVEEQELRRRLGKPVYPLDEKFLAAVGSMPPSAGIAVGLDRLLMLCLGARRIADVLLFPAQDFFETPDGGTK